MKMNFNLKNRIRNITFGKKNVFLPMFEAISNSVQSIFDRKPIDPKIDITIHRDLSFLKDDVKGIASIEIIDNGVGFNKENLDSFNTLDSDFKLKIGGKGIGRISWLAAFEKVEIESLYMENDIVHKVNIKFTINNQVEVLSDVIVEDIKLYTKIKLINSNMIVRENTCISLKEIADKIISHFANYFILKNYPIITLYSDDKDSLIVNNYFKEEKYLKLDSNNFIFNDNEFFCSHIFLKTTAKKKHKIIFCAQNRVVKEYIIDDVEDMPDIFKIDGFDAEYNILISGSKLDSDVNSERNQFNTITFSKNEEDGLLVSSNMYKIIMKIVTQYLIVYLEPLKIEKEEKIINHITTLEPQYSYLLSIKKDDLMKIPQSAINDKKKLSNQLFYINKKISLETQTKFEEILKKEDLDYSSQLKELVNLVNGDAKTELTEYVLKRNLIIKLLYKILGFYRDGKFEDEKVLHNIIIPMNNTSASLSYKDHNLWLIDERLAYDYYLFSDISLNKILYECKSKDKPDGFFANAISFTEAGNEKKEVSNVTLLEFKKPQRNDYTESENPHNQLIKYIKEIRKNKSLIGKSGMNVSISENINFNCYIIADLTPSLVSVLESYDYKKLPMGNGYYKFHDHHKAYIEVLPYLKIVNNAEMRNKAFLEKLRLNS